MGTAPAAETTAAAAGLAEERSAVEGAAQAADEPTQLLHIAARGQQLGLRRVQAHQRTERCAMHRMLHQAKL